MSKTFEARYRGICSSCDEGFEPGNLVRFVDATLVHSACPDPGEEPTPPRRPAQVCTACWLEKPCPCDDGLVAP